MLKYLDQMYQRLDDHTKEIVQGTFKAFFLKVLSVGIAFGLNVAIGRLLGADGAGLYFLAFTVTTIAATVGRIGLDNTLVRFIAANAVVEDWSAVKGVYAKSMLISLAMSSIVTILLVLLTPWLTKFVFDEPELTLPLTVMAFAITPLALLILHAQALIGLRRIQVGILVLNIFAPLFTLIGMILMVPIWGVAGAAAAYVIAAIFTLIIGVWQWRGSTYKLVEIKGYFNTRELLDSGVPLFWTAIFQQISLWTPTIMLGIMTNTEQVGIYSAANRTALLTSLILMIVNSVSRPKFAALYKQGNFQALGYTARNSAKLLIITTAPVVILLVLYSNLIMGIFGPSFVVGSTVLCILAIGQFVNAATGSVGSILVMSGNEKLVRNILIFSSTTNLVLTIVLTKYYGITGAAVATALTIAVQNLIATVLVWKKLRVYTLPIFSRITESSLFSKL